MDEATRRPIAMIQTSLARAEDAGRISRKAVELGLAACAQTLGPMRSCYRWQQAIEEAEEWLLIFKTDASLAPELVRWLEREHPYELPEIISLPAGASPAYAAWVHEETVVRKTHAG